mgnify:FL=1
MAVTALIPWYGSDRMVVEELTEHLKGCSWVGVPCAGGMAALKYITARTIVVNDLHRHAINLARVIKDKDLFPQLIETATSLPFHPDVLAEAQLKARHYQGKLGDTPNLSAAIAYFIAVWMGRSGNAGTSAEFKGKLALRWNAGGGDSNIRYRSAIAAAEEFHAILQRCTFSTLDIFEFLDLVKDEAEHGLYIDAPWPGAGDKYLHTVENEFHAKLSLRLLEFQKVRLVVRYSDHELVRGLYPEREWRREHRTGRDQANQGKGELLIIRN